MPPLPIPPTAGPPDAATARLDGPPPSPALPPGAPGSGVPMMAGAPGGEGGAADPVETMVRMASGLNAFIMSLARTFPDASEDFGAAREALKRGFAKVLASAGKAPATSPTAAGAPFPGGGFSSPDVGMT